MMIFTAKAFLQHQTILGTSLKSDNAAMMLELLVFLLANWDLFLTMLEIILTCRIW